VEALDHRHERTTLVGAPAEQIGDNGGLGGIGAGASGVARAIGVGPVSVRCPGPRRHQPALQLVEASATHALSDQGAFIRGDGPADLQEQPVLGIVGERSIGELYPAAVTPEFIQEQDLMDLVTRQSIRFGDEDAVELGQDGEVPEPVEAGTPQRGPGRAVVAEDLISRELPPALSDDASQSAELLIRRKKDRPRGSPRPPESSTPPGRAVRRAGAGAPTRSVSA
jgi:hypothetical protein